ncbi:hypothetical protein HYR99_06615 [Candidatus Poribacteria bacterium]|nr:hypothetical protein [Candidatus Poribacteria bacterium]
MNGHLILLSAHNALNVIPSLRSGQALNEAKAFVRVRFFASLRTTLCGLLITFLANTLPAFAEEGSNSVKQQVDSLLADVQGVETQLDRFRDSDGTFAPNAIQNLRELDTKLSLIEKKRQNIDTTKLTEAEKKAIQNQLDSLKEETSALQMQVKALLRYAQLFQSMETLIKNSNEGQKQGFGISSIILYFVLLGIVGLLVLSVLQLTRYRRNDSRRLDALEKLQKQTLSKMGEQERFGIEVKSIFIRKGELTLQKQEESFQRMESALQRLIKLIQNQKSQIPADSPSQKKQNDSYQPQEKSPRQMFCHLYNVAVEDSNARDEFIRRYQPIQISVANAMERRRDSSIEPRFQTADGGGYYAVAVEENMPYVIVPRFDLTFQDSLYREGAMGQVFECPNYDVRQHYPRVKVVKPALFEPDSAKQHWTLKEKGQLDLGPGE